MTTAGATDVVIVGAGLAGLAAAAHLREQGVKVLILEARSRIGGRLKSVRTLDGVLVELGGRDIASYHSEIRRLCDRLGVPLLAGGHSDLLPPTVVIDGTPLSADRRWHLNDDLVEVIERTVELASDLSEPVAASNGSLRALSAVAVETWLTNDGASTDVLATFSDLPLGSQSVIALLRLIEGAAGTAFYYESDAYAFAAGAATLTDALARGLGDCILMNHAVVSVSDEWPSGVRIDAYAPSGDVCHVRASAAILAVPPPSLRSIRDLPFSPTCYPARMVGNRYLTLRAVLTEPLPDAGAAILTNGIIRSLWAAPMVGTGSDRDVRIDLMIREDSPGHGLAVRTLADEAASVLGRRIEQLKQTWEERWDRSSWSNGSYCTFAPSAVPRVPVPEPDRCSIVLAGDHTQPQFAGYMEGAVRSGLHAAAACLQRL